jgi:hypothetical protein
LGEILETHIDEEHFDSSNRANINITSLQPLVYCPVIREYWSVGEKLGKGFDAGKAILKAVEEKPIDEWTQAKRNVAKRPPID